MPAVPEAGLPPSIPPGRAVTLPGRGTTWIREARPPGSDTPGRPPLMLLHGWTATSALNWGASMATLGREFHVLAVDHRGHGRGIRTSTIRGSIRGFRLEDCADDVIAIADALGLEKVIPVGYSMGGPIAQLTWRRHPDRVAGLVLCATARRFGQASQPALRLALAGGVVGAAAAVRSLPPPIRRQLGVVSMTWRRRALGLPDWVLEEVGRNDPAAVLEALRALQRFDSSEWIGEVDVPTAVVVTTRDRLIAPQRQLRLAASIDGATVWPVEGDHAVCAAQPGRFVPVLLQACRSVMTLSGDGVGSATGR